MKTQILIDDFRPARRPPASAAFAAAAAPAARRRRRQAAAGPAHRARPSRASASSPTSAPSRQSTAGVAVQARLQQLTAQSCRPSCSPSAPRSRPKAAPWKPSGPPWRRPVRTAGRPRLQDRASRPSRKRSSCASNELEATSARRRCNVVLELNPIVASIYQAKNCSIVIDGQSLVAVQPGHGHDHPGLITQLNAQLPTLTFERDRLDQQPRRPPPPLPRARPSDDEGSGPAVFRTPGSGLPHRTGRADRRRAADADLGGVGRPIRSSAVAPLVRAGAGDGQLPGRPALSGRPGSDHGRAPASVARPSSPPAPGAAPRLITREPQVAYATAAAPACTGSRLQPARAAAESIRKPSWRTASSWLRA